MSSATRDQPGEQATTPQGPGGAQPIDVTVEQSPEATVSTAGRDIYTGNVIVNVTVGTTSDKAENLAKEIEKNIPAAMSEAFKERRREEKLEEEIADFVAAVEPSQDLLVEVERWFRQDLSTDRERYFAMALSLFNGLKWADFWDIYQAILESKELLAGEDEKRGASLFKQTDEELIAKARACIVREEDRAAEVVEFKDTNYPKVVLDFLRSKYRPRLVELLPGLGKLGEHPYWEIRARAAYAVAEIGKLDFYRVRGQVLEVWAQDERSYVRAAVGYAASRLIKDEVADTEVRKMLDEWADPKESRGWKFRWAAAAAHKQVGLDNPDVALSGLKLVARNDDLRVADAVIYALLVISFDDKLEAVLRALKEWLDEDDDSKKEPNVVPLVATLAFLTLGNAYTGLAEHEPDEGEEKEDNTLLALLAADVEGTWRAVVMAALSRALKYKLADEAFDVFKGWARQAQDSETRSAAVRDLIADWYMTLWQDQHQIGMTSTWNRLRSWARDEDKAVKEAAQVTLAEIKRRVNAAPVPDSPQRQNKGKAIVFGSTPES